MKTIHSEVENYHVKGGSRSKTPWGPHQVVKDSTYMEREKHQLKKYFREIATTIADADSIVIYGPAETNLKLEKELKENFKDIAKKVLKVEKADSMTTNQVKALIRDFYNN
jgi:tRNA uridine 5-carbamoylmethylation protein Kti12